MSTKKFAVAAIIIGTLGIACEVAQIVLYDTHLSMEWSYPANHWNYLAFFTVITNLLVDLWLITLAVAVLAKARRLYAILTAPWLQGALVLYIACVGIVYCTLLFWFIGPYSLELWWANIIDMWNHLLLPVTMLVLWFTAPHTKPLRWRTLGFWMIFPVTYFILSEIRGLVWDWYPYPFFRPSWVMFPLGILITTGCFLGVGALLIYLHNRKVRSCKKSKSNV